MSLSNVSNVRCRQIGPDDLGAVVDLLHRGFPERSPQALSLSLDRLGAHDTPAGFPKFGYVLEADHTFVGAILVIFSSTVVDGRPSIRGNVAFWYVRPDFRQYGAMLSARALARRDVTFLNLSPAPHTWPILEAQGYRRWSSGVYAAVPAISAMQRRTRVREFSAHVIPGADLSAYDVRVLRDHAGYGCTSVICASGGRRHPFVFGPRRWIRWKSIPLPYATLTYARNIDDFVAHSGPLGRFLLRRGIGLVFIDSDGGIPGLLGKFLAWGPKFVRGPNPPALGDIAYTESVMFDL